MSKSIRVKITGIQFPEQCVVCARPAEQAYMVERNLSYGNTSRLIRVPVPMCQEHFDLASSKNALERAMNSIGLALGGIAGLASGWVLFSWWMDTEQGNVFLDIFLALVVALGIFLVVWILLGYFVAPAFADPKVKRVRSAVKIDHFWPADNVVQLTIADPQLSEKVLQLSSQ